MASKAKVVALAKKQGATVEVIQTWDGTNRVEIYLPNGFIWKNGYGSGSFLAEQDPGEPMSSIWLQAWAYINVEVVAE